MLVTIIVGALSGWIASMIMKKDAAMGAIANIVVGIVGSFIGNAIFKALGQSTGEGLNLYSVLVSVIGACILLFIVDKITK